MRVPGGASAWQFWRKISTDNGASWVELARWRQIHAHGDGARPRQAGVVGLAGSVGNQLSAGAGIASVAAGGEFGS